MSARSLIRDVMVCGLIVTAPLVARGQAPADTTRTDGLPKDRGQLPMSTATITLYNGNLQILFIPMDERVLRLITRDSYLGMESILTQQRRAIDSTSRDHNVTAPGIAFVSFQALAPATRFDPGQLTLTVHGQTLYPEAWIPMSATFSNQQLDARQQVQALFLYRTEIPVREAFSVSYLGATSDDWTNRLPRFDAERSRILATVRSHGDTVPR